MNSSIYWDEEEQGYKSFYCPLDYDESWLGPPEEPECEHEFEIKFLLTSSYQKCKLCGKEID